ncbi:helix-turn-helix transcriptional regulator [Streptomyces antarcticus]|uniref:helix-turn-helix transcriptional regulator n=1 Tax=Streptomyces antarcticus TaxID=2996458 RepID=UPI003F675DFC
MDRLPLRTAWGRGAMAVTSPRTTQKLTVDEVCAELQVARSTFYDWRQKGRAPRCIRLPNGALRIRRSDFENWLTDCEAHS